MTTTTVPTGIAAKRSTRAAWILMAAQFGYVLWFGLCVWVALTRAAHFAGHYYIPYQGDQYTANVEIFTGWSRTFYTPLMLTAGLQPIIAVASLGLTAWQLAQKSTRSRRVLFWLLVASGVLVFATFVLSCTPDGRLVVGWILD